MYYKKLHLQRIISKIMATFCYRIRSIQRNKLVKIQILFTVGRGNQFYIDSQYWVLTDTWDNKRLRRHRPEIIRRFRGVVYSEELLDQHHRRHVKELKIIMRAAREEGLHDNSLIESRKFRVLTADVENIYLTESEIRAIADLDLSNNKHKDIARDVFLVGCYTAQRFSDYSTINEGNIRTLESGQRVIDLKQQKTGNHVVIPIRPELQSILDKYEDRLPKAYEQKVNEFIKEVAREAGITEKIEVS